MGRLASHIASHRVLLVISFRPEFEAPWIEQAHVTALALSRLAPRDVDVIIDHIIGNNPLPAAVRQDIIERTDGIPLFVEEMTKAVLETASEDAAAADRRFGSLFCDGGPGKLARIVDGAARPARRRQESLRRSELRSVANSPMNSWLRSRADRRRSWKCSSTDSSGRGCCSARACRRTPPIFSSMLLCKTRPMACCCASRDAIFMLESPKPSRASSTRSPRTSPRCWRVTGPRRAISRRAATLWGKAGRRSAERSALVEATEQLRRALDLIASLAQHARAAPRRDQASGRAHHSAPPCRGYAAPETRAAVERARLLIEQSEDSRRASRRSACCCSPFFTACGWQTLSPSTAT